MKRGSGSFKEFYERFGMFFISGFILLALAAGIVLEFGYKNLFWSNVLYIIGISPGGLQLLAERFDTF